MTNRVRSTGLATVSVFVLTVALLAPVACAKSYHFASVDIKATVLSNGDIRIVEDRTARFVGSFSELCMRVSVRLGRSQTSASTTQGASSRRAAQGRPAFRVEQKGGRPQSTSTTVRAGSARSADTIRNAIIVYRDVAELYWKFIGEGWDVRTDRVRVEVFFPSEVTQEELRVWAHGPLQGEVVRTDTPSLLATVESLNPRTFVECRAAFPTSAVPAATRKVNKDGLEAILKEETEWANQANAIRDRVRQQLARGEYVDMESIEKEIELSRQPRWRRWLVGNDRIVALSILVMALVALIAIRIKYDREHRPEFEGDYYRELPADYSPAVLGVLWRFGSPASEDFTAEIMNLARRGPQDHRGTDREEASLGSSAPRRPGLHHRRRRSSQRRPRAARLRETDRFLFDLGSGQSVSFDEITAYCEEKTPGLSQEIQRMEGGDLRVCREVQLLRH